LRIKTKEESYFSWIEMLFYCHAETRRRSTQIDQCKCAFSISVESERSLIGHVETRFQFWSCG
jgi:hypothetical protein